MKALFLILIIFAFDIYGQVENSKNAVSLRSSPFFYYDIANYKGPSDSLTRVDVFLQVPYSKIQFLKTSNGYKATFNINLKFRDALTNETILEREWTESLSALSYETTISSKNFNISYRSYLLKPGEYNIKIGVEDNASQIERQVEVKAKVLKFEKPFGISDLMLITKKMENSKKIVPNISHNISSNDQSISFFYEVYSDSVRDTEIIYQISNRTKEEYFSQKFDKQLKPGKNLIYQTLDKKDLTIGEYSLIVKVVDKNNKQQVGIGKKFYSKIYNFPNSIMDLDKAIEQMIYIASSSEIERIKEAKTYKEKLDRYLRYWKEKDPSPHTEENEILNEYYRRVEYANSHFKSYYEGWRTDMGMIYITLGPPSQVERHPFEYGSKPYEIWEYFDLNRRFVFVDQTGFGDYRLLNPDYGDWYKYRY